MPKRKELVVAKKTRKGDAIYRRGNTWWLDTVIRGKRHFRCLGKNISRTVAKELAQVERSRILKGEAGIGQKKMRKDLTFDKAVEVFLDWAVTNRRPRTASFYKECLEHPIVKNFLMKT